MKKTVLRALLTGISVFTLFITSHAADLEQTAKNNNAFGCDVYRTLKQTPGNLMISPTSLATALSMTYYGARRQTEKEMRTVLHLDLTQSELPKAYAALAGRLEEIEASGKVKLTTANALWCQQEFHFEKPYLDCMQQDFKAAVFFEDFHKAYADASQHINRWVSSRTNHKIPELVSPPIVQDAKLVLCNAVYFKGDWLSAFKPAATRKDTFFVTPSQKTTVPLMNQKLKLPYLNFGHFSAIALPYQGKEVSMVLLLPEAKDGLADLENQLTGDVLEDWMNSLFNIARPQEVTVTLPKFKAEFKCELSNSLKTLGMPDAFDIHTADFTGMTGQAELYISKVVHKTFIAVDESGTEAAAATAVVMRAKATSFHEPVFFRADHPFIYFIRDNQTGSMLFMGRVANPE